MRGLAHVGVLERLDDLGIRPCAIAGCSIGALLGALYAAGHSGRWIREIMSEAAPGDEDGWREVLKKKASLLRWVTSLTPEIQRGGLLNIDRLLHHLMKPVAKMSFSDLAIPLTVVATDFWAAEEFVITEGPVLRAVRASMAVPGIFAPVLVGDRILVDGGLVNQLPYEHLLGSCDLIIAVDASGERTPGSRKSPTTPSAIMGASDIMQRALLNQKLKKSPPAILVRPRIRNVEMLDIAKMDAMLKLGSAAGDEVEAKLRELGAIDS